ncbi:hypothetical protein PAXINDRAFT_111464 [Paxillus involutus ATCC 200175]|nr:hypothetical protein PAXINDRAFT_111464 [Paxillus involutus ATCC 200175]
MDQFGYTHLPAELNGMNIHCLQNVLMLDLCMHVCFNELILWFEHTDTPNTYNVCWKSKRWLFMHGAKPTMTLRSPDLEKLPLPSPEYLQIHAACAKVANLSGASNYI